MLAVLKEEPKPNTLSVRDIGSPPKKPDHLVIRVLGAGVCGSDLHTFFWTEDYEKRFQNHLPVILGHEFAGVVEEIGRGVEGFKVGDRVVARPGISCNRCKACLSGNDGICPNRRAMGVDYNGAMAEFLSIPTQEVFRLPEKFPMEIGPLIEPITIAYNAVLKAGSLLGKDVVVLGPGPIGYLISLLLRGHVKSQTIIGLNKDRARMEKLQAQIPNIRAIEQGASRKGKEETLDADIFFEVTGSRGGFQQSLEMGRRNATVILVGIISDQVSIDSNLAVRGEFTIRGSHAAPRRIWKEVIELISSFPQNETDRFLSCITHRFPLQRAKEAFQLVASGEGLKVLFIPENRSA